jgi:chitodextrinase
VSVSTLRRLAILGTGALGVLVAVGIAAGPVHAATQLSTPGTPVATNVTMTSVSFSWAPSSGAVANYTVQTIDVVGNPWRDLATTTGTSYTHSGLVQDSVYEYRIIANPVANSGYTASAPTPLLWVRTRPTPDSVPPTTPTNLRSYNVSTAFATILFDPSTDNHRVDAYVVQRQINGVWTDVGTNNITQVYLRDLTPNTTYTVVAVAGDAHGTRSPRSAPLTFTTRPAQPTPGCKVQLIVYSNQYQVVLTIENMTVATVLSNWNVSLTFPPGHTLQYAFNGTFTRTGPTTGQLTPAVYLAQIGPGGSAFIGFLATYPTGAPLPSNFTLNSSVGAFPCTPQPF